MYRGEQPGARAAAGSADEWDARYREREAMWSGRVNGQLVQQVGDLPPGRALDVGCGEGADAIWLAGRGWQVSAVDISAVAIERAERAAAGAGLVIEWLCGDVLELGLPPRCFDLVSMQYPALPRRSGQKRMRRLLETVRPGGLLLAVYHDLGDEHLEQLRARGVEPSDYLLANDLLPLLGADFVIERHTLEPRVDPPPGTPHVADVLIRARRSVRAGRPIGTRTRVLCRPAMTASVTHPGRATTNPPT